MSSNCFDLMDGGVGAFADDRFGQCQTFGYWGRDRWMWSWDLMPAPATNVKLIGVSFAVNALVVRLWQ